MQPSSSPPPGPTAPTPRRRATRQRLTMTIAILTAVLTGVAAVTATASAASVATSSTSRDGQGGYGQADLQRDLDAIRSAGAVGVQARVLTPDGDHLTATSGVADTHTHQPVPADGHFRAGSITKPIVAAVVLQLVGEETLSLDDTVDEHLPGVVAGNGNHGHAITIRQLLQHTSGLYDYAQDVLPPLLSSYEDYLAHRDETYRLEELAAIAMRHPPTFAPGTRWAYSNTGYILAGMLIEQVTGNPWDQEVQRRILKPLGLEHTTAGVGDGPGLPDPHAKGYQQFAPGGPLADVTVYEPSRAATAGGIISTTSDLGRFFGALLGGELLPPAQLAQMQTTVPATGAFQEYGLGLGSASLSCGRWWGHGGGAPGYQNVAAFTSDGSRGIVLSVSSSHLDEQPSRQQLAALLQTIDHALCAAT